MNVRPSTSVSRAPCARLMNSGSAPTDRNARTGLSTPPGSRRTAFANSVFDRGARMSANLDRGEIADGRAQKPLLVAIARAVARGVEGARGAVEVALDEKRRCDTERRAVR